MSQGDSSAHAPPATPYDKVKNRALSWKAYIQMLVGVFTLLAVLAFVGLESYSQYHDGVTWFSDSAGTKGILQFLQKGIFDVVGVGLAIAAAAELAYTLFTDGPDEALDPALLAVSAALIIQLGADIDGFSWSDALTTCLFVIAIAGLFATRWYLKDLSRPRQRRGPAAVHREGACDLDENQSNPR